MLRIRQQPVDSRQFGKVINTETQFRIRDVAQVRLGFDRRVVDYLRQGKATLLGDLQLDGISRLHAQPTGVEVLKHSGQAHRADSNRVGEPLFGVDLTQMFYELVQDVKIHDTQYRIGIGQYRCQLFYGSAALRCDASS